MPKSLDNLTDGQNIRKLFKKKRRSAYLFSILIVMACSRALNFAFYKEILFLLLCAVLTAMAFWTWKKRPGLPAGGLSLDACEYLQNQHDKYTK